jgi:chromosome partitioning protein
VRTIAIINQKGGCGKTTTAINLAGLLARAGRRTLLVDMDPQSHCAAGLGIPEHRLDMDIGDAMVAVNTGEGGQRTIDGSRLLWKAGRNLDLAPSRMRLAGLEAPRGPIAMMADKERRLAMVLDQFRKEYDLAIIDCSPAIGLLTFNALLAADMVIIPVETSFFSLQGATKQVNTIKTLARRIPRPLGVWLLPTIHDADNAVASDLLLELKRRFKDRLVPVVVRRDVKLREAASFGQTIIDYDPRSTGAEDYTALATWTLDTASTMPEAGAFPGFEPAVGATGGVHGELPDPALIEVLPQDASTVTPRPAPTTLAHEIANAAPAYHTIPSPPGMATTGTEAFQPEIKSISRAEDVARRAQAFLRRMATGAPASAANVATMPVAATATMPPPAPMPGTTVTPLSPLTGGGTAAGMPTMPSSSVSVAAPLHPITGPHPTLRLIEEAKLSASTLNSATQGLLGARPTRPGVLFVQPLTVGKKICIAGDFNGWSATSAAMKKNEALGVYELCLKLEPGRYRYRLVIDGIWTADQFNEAAEMNPFGELNSIVVVPANV